MVTRYRESYIIEIANIKWSSVMLNNFFLTHDSMIDSTTRIFIRYYIIQYKLAHEQTIVIERPNNIEFITQHTPAVEH